MEVKDLDSLMKEVVKAREQYEEKKKISSECYSKLSGLEDQLTEAMQSLGKTKWSIDGVGSINLVNKFMVKVPDSIEDRRLLYEYIKNKYGEETVLKKFSVHSRTLNSFYNEEMENSEDPSLFSLPGVDTPTHTVNLRFTKHRS